MDMTSCTKANTNKEKLLCNTLHIAHSKCLGIGTQKHVVFNLNRAAETEASSICT